jgi:hypothetical protein
MLNWGWVWWRFCWVNQVFNVFIDGLLEHRRLKHRKYPIKWLKFKKWKKLKHRNSRKFPTNLVHQWYFSNTLFGLFWFSISFWRFMLLIVFSFNHRSALLQPLEPRLFFNLQFLVDLSLNFHRDLQFSWWTWKPVEDENTSSPSQLNLNRLKQTLSTSLMFF